MTSSRLRTLSAAAALLAASSLMFAACGGDGPTQGNTTPATTTAVADDAPVYDRTDRTIAVRVNESMAIELPSNPSTGYQWTLAPMTGSARLALVNSTFFPDDNPDGAVGVGGMDRFTFQALQSGTATLRFDLFPPAGGKAEESATFTVRVTNPQPKKVKSPPGTITTKTSPTQGQGIRTTPPPMADSAPQTTTPQATPAP